MPDEGTIDAPIGRDPRDRTRMAVVESASGKYARTHYRTIDRAMWNNQPVSAVHCDLDTGRTHQIRVHCAHIRHPLLGDPIYGHARGKRSVQPLPDGFNRQALHAWRLGLIHPTTGRDISWRADVPEDIEALAAELGLGRDEATDLDPEDADFIDEDDGGVQVRGGWDESQPIEYDDDDEE
jgi:23S rRNA pseudouridine1911/1915/1917 synthase